MCKGEARMNLTPFEKILNEKTNKNLPEGFDNLFWEKFESVRPVEKKFKLLEFLMPGLSLAVAALFVLFIYKNTIIKDPTHNSNLLVEVLENQELLEDMELLGTFEDVELSDDEWKILLSEVKS